MNPINIKPMYRLYGKNGDYLSVFNSNIEKLKGEAKKRTYPTMICQDVDELAIVVFARVPKGQDISDTYMQWAIKERNVTPIE